MKDVAALICGLLFGAGLVVSGMANPAKVLNFLDLAGTWDASLLLVMAGAVAVSAIGYRIVWQRQAPLLAPAFQVPAASLIDARLLAGAAVFGLGWGLAGLCPGPALVALSTGSAAAVIFFAAMVGGLWAARITGTRAAPELASAK